MRVSLVGRAHELIRCTLRPGDVAVDATIGNGHDTVFLAECVGKQGRVYGFDIQCRAIAATTARLAEAGLGDRVTLFETGHEHVVREIPVVERGAVRAVMFNLGYLPGSDKSVVTRPPSTLAALDQTCGIVAPGGRVSVMVYKGHPGGRDEADAVSAWAEQLDPRWWTVDRLRLVTRPDAPELLMLSRC